MNDTFHGLRIICRCGSGGFGEVFFVEDISCKKMALKVVPKSAQYKLAGNSIVVDVLVEIFRPLFLESGQK